MPDLTTSFERFKDELSRQRQEFNQHMAKIEGQNKELERTFDGKISELIDLQKESLRSQKEQASLEKIRGKEEDIESGRASKSRESTADDIGETKEHSKNIAGGIKSIAASFMNPKLLAGMFALAIADAMTKVNLTGTRHHWPVLRSPRRAVISRRAGRPRWPRSQRRRRRRLMREPYRS